MTERLYYDQPYLKNFEAVVISVKADEDKYHVLLDRSAFYPTSGGQPFDTGRINDGNVTDVYVDDMHEVWHVVDREFKTGDKVNCCIDWERRFDHMQQHAGDHMIASAIHRLFGGVTIGLHISNDTSTIDVSMPRGAVRIDAYDIMKIELDVNARIQADVPIRCWFPNSDELSRLPLRKAPTVSENVRIVAIGDDEMVACGGTHPKTAGELGVVKILNVTPARGKMRVCFVAGKRALLDYEKKHACTAEVANMLSTTVDNIPGHVANLLERIKNTDLELSRLKRQMIFDRIPEMINKGIKLESGAVLIYEMLDCDIQVLKDAASKIIKQPGLVVLFGANAGSGAMFVFARSSDVDMHMGQILSAAARPHGGKGGGRPDFAQGGGSPDILETAIHIITECNENGGYK